MAPPTTKNRGLASPKTSRHFDDKRTGKESDIFLRQYAQSFHPSTNPAVPPSLPLPRTESAVPKEPAALTKKNLRALQHLENKRTSIPATTSEAHMRRKGSPKKQDRKKSKEDPDSHPLNLPPDELRRLSAAMAQDQNGKDPMVLDNDTLEPVTSPSDEQRPGTPSRETPVAFPESTAGTQTPNGVNGQEEKSPTPPPHKVQPPPKVDTEACKAAGNKFFKAKDYERAIAEYTKAVDAEPQNPTYLSNRSAAYISANKYDSALTDSLQASQLDPSNDKILHRLARIYTSLGRPQDALDTYARIPNGVSAKDTAAAKVAVQAIASAENNIQSEDGNGNMAIWSLDQAKQTLGYGIPWPRRWQLLRAKANLKIGSANALGEVQAIATALTRDNPTDAEALVVAGRAFYLKDEKPRGGKSDYQRAEDCFRQALNLDPDMSDARNCLRTMKKLERARDEANKVFKGGKYSESVNRYTECLTIDPKNKVTNAKLLGNRAMARIKIKEFDEAAADCEQALKLDPTYTKARKTKAKAVGEGGDWQQAVTELKALAEENPGDHDIAKEVRQAELELKKSKRKDYYKILGVEKDADEPQINRAYKRQALKCHPDKFQGDKKKEEEFKELQEANEVLSDRTKRERYDSGVDLMEPGEGMGGFPGGFGGMGGGGGVQIDPEILMNMMGGGGFGGGGRGGGMPHFQFNTGGGGGRGGGFPF